MYWRSHQANEEAEWHTCNSDADSQDKDKLRYWLEECPIIFRAGGKYAVKASFGW
jgi:hypothetical protein